MFTSDWDAQQILELTFRTEFMNKTDKLPPLLTCSGSVLWADYPFQGSARQSRKNCSFFTTDDVEDYLAFLWQNLRNILRRNLRISFWYDNNGWLLIVRHIFKCFSSQAWTLTVFKDWRRFHTRWDASSDSSWTGNEEQVLEGQVRAQNPSKLAPMPEGMYSGFSSWRSSI